MSARFSIEGAAADGGVPTRVRWPMIIGFVLTPVIIAAVLAWGFGAVQSRVDTVQAIVVNHDKMVTYQGQKVPLGRQFAAKLIAGDDQFDWQLNSEKTAAKKLRKGQIAAVVTIPRDFSHRAISYAQHPKSAKQAMIDVTTSKQASVLDSSLTASLVTSARQAFNTDMTETYLKNIYVSYGTLSDQLGSAADGADQLGDGSKQVQRGTASLATGAYTLSNGLDTLATGTSKYVAGVGSLAKGSSSLSTGASKLAHGVKPLNGGAQQLASGAAQLAAGVPPLNKGAKQLASGLKQSDAGAAQLADGLDELNKNMPDLKSGSQQVAQGAGGLAELLSKTEQLRAACASGGDAGEEACATYGKTLAEFSTSGMNITQLAGGVDDGATKVAGGISGDGTAKNPGVAGGVKQASDGADDLSDGISKLSTGASSLAGGTRKLQTGVNGLASGASGLAAGTSKLSSGASSLASGTQKLASGAAQAAAAGPQLTTGARQAAGGAAALGNGAGKLTNGSKQVTHGINKLGGGLHDAVDAIPSYTKAQRTQLATVVASPLKATASPLHGLFGGAVMPWVTALALWLGLLAVYIVVRPISRRARFSTKSALALAGRSYIPGAIIGALSGAGVGVLAAVIADVGVRDGATMVGLSILAGLSFAAVHQGLAGLLGWFGRFLGVIMGVLIAIVVMVATVPNTLVALADLTPLSSLIDGLQTQVTGASGIITAIAGLVIWGLLGFVMSVFGTLRARSTMSAEARTPAVSQTIR